jgi:ABC-type glycerol-3-phosphate transport system substrate-binding protein
VDSTFLIEWAAAAGYIPTRSSSIAEWPLPETRVLVEQIAAAAHPYPPEDILLVIGPVLKQATLDVLIGQMPPQQAAEKAVSDLSGK